MDLRGNRHGEEIHGGLLNMKILRGLWKSELKMVRDWENIQKLSFACLVSTLPLVFARRQNLKARGGSHHSLSPHA